MSMSKLKKKITAGYNTAGSSPQMLSNRGFGHRKNKVPQTASKKTDADENTEHSPAAYIDVREEASTGSSPQMLSNRGFGLYFHWPFCLTKCPYCNFYSKTAQEIPQEKIVDDYLQELDFYHHYTADQKIRSIFFGGGTPSLLKPQLIEKLINVAAQKWTWENEVEISLEANPNTQHPGLFSALKSAGVNRLSLGIQALNDEDLKFLGRSHNLGDAYNAMEEVLRLFDNHSVDLIYARPGQTVQAWQKELSAALNFGFKHMSLYQLTIEPGTSFFRRGIKEAEEETARELYQLTDFLTTEAGYPRYEISNYAADAFRCRHNLLYWQGGDYVGIGRGAHGRFNRDGKFYASVHRCKLHELTRQEKAEELLLTGLRLKEGIDKKRFAQITGLDFDGFVAAKGLKALSETDLIINQKDKLAVSDEGCFVLDSIISMLCP